MLGVRLRHFLEVCNSIHNRWLLKTLPVSCHYGYGVPSLGLIPCIAICVSGECFPGGRSSGFRQGNPIPAQRPLESSSWLVTILPKGLLSLFIATLSVSESLLYQLEWMENVLNLKSKAHNAIILHKQACSGPGGNYCFKMIEEFDPRTGCTTACFERHLTDGFHHWEMHLFFVGVWKIMWFKA